MNIEGDERHLTNNPRTNREFVTCVGSSCRTMRTVKVKHKPGVQRQVENGEETGERVKTRQRTKNGLSRACLPSAQRVGPGGTCLRGSHDK